MFAKYSDYLVKTFGAKTYKVVVSSHFTCPTRDGSVDKKGCAFCDVRGSSSFYGTINRGKSVQEQLLDRIPAIQKRFNAKHFLAYFQSYTNTYGDLDTLKSLISSALQVPGVKGVCIGTRPDCLSDACLAYLNELSQQTAVHLEWGVQSLEDPVLQWLKRGHDAKESWDALARLDLKAPGVHTCVHLMFGAPMESALAARYAAQMISAFGVKGVKLHQLMVLKKTQLAQWYQEKPFSTISLEAYADLVCEFIRYLRSDIYLERLFATATHPEECLAPEWSKQRWHAHNVILKRIKEKKATQAEYLLQT
jgi:radical SAM protein (TIGR01212 family)